MSIKNKPDFFSIGPAKSGTSWQLHHFGRHPQIKRPVIKDLNFFEESDLFSFIKSKHLDTATDKTYGNYFDLYDGSNLKDFEKVLKLRKVQQKKNFHSVVNFKNLMGLHFSEIFYGLKFSFLTRELNQQNLEHYCNALFKTQKGKISGDLSTNYFNLSNRAIELIAHNFPALKIIIGIRNPVERRWSYLRMEQKDQEQKGKGRIIDKQMAELPDPDSDYKSAILNWTHYFPLEQIHFAFFDELEKDPVNYLKKIYDFLGVDFKTDMVDPSYRNKGKEMEIPKEIEEVLQKNLAGQFEFLLNYFPNNADIKNWKVRGKVKIETGS